MHIFHWWPGREYRKNCPIPDVFVNEAVRMGSRYLTYAVLEDEGRMVEGFAFCCHKDVPSRKRGKQIAVGRIMSIVDDFGLVFDDALLRS